MLGLIAKRSSRSFHRLLVLRPLLDPSRTGLFNHHHHRHVSSTSTPSVVSVEDYGNHNDNNEEEEEEEDDNNEDDDEDDDDDGFNMPPSDDDDDDDDYVTEPWKALLTHTGRCSWRVSRSDPDHLHKISSEIITTSGRTRKQLRLVHESTMEKHKEFAQIRERERNRLKSGGTGSKKEMQVIVYGVNEALANLYFRLVPQYQVLKRILQEASSLMGVGRFRPKRIIDVGMGTGAATVAALEVFDGSIEWVHGIEPSNPMKQLAETVLSKLTPAPRLTVSSYLSVTSETSQFDMGLLSYTASEFTTSASTIAAAAALWQKLAPGGIFVMVEPGTPDGFHSCRTVRTMLLDCANDSSTVCDIIAPCTHNGACPMAKIGVDNKVFKKVKKKKMLDKKKVKGEKQKAAENDDDDTKNSDEFTRSGFCSFVHTMPDGDKKEKFSYLVARKKPITEEDDENVFHGDNLTLLLQETLTEQQQQQQDHEEEESPVGAKVADLVDRYVNNYDDNDPCGLELVRSVRSEFGRIIHAPKKRRGHILLDVCAAPGQMVRCKVTKSLSKQAPGIYAASKKSRWGGYWPNVPALDEAKK